MFLQSISYFAFFLDDDIDVPYRVQPAGIKFRDNNFRGSRLTHKQKNLIPSKISRYIQ